jgi:hypothetical protein
MREISETLQAAQNAVSNTPYIRIVPTSPDGVTTYDYSSDQNRLRQLEHVEEAYNDYATIILNNSDGGVQPDITGYWMEIGYGYDTGSNEYSSTSRLWIKSQMDFSAEGQVYTMLELGGMWDVLRETLIRTGDPPFYIRYDDPETGNTSYHAGATVYELIAYILAEASDDNYTFTLAELESSDGIVDSYVPTFEVNTINLFEDALSLIKRLVDMTYCTLRVKSGLEFELFYPPATKEDLEADETYYSYQVPFFIEYLYKLNLAVPNHILLFANAGDDGMWTNIITAEASDEDQIAKYRDVYEIHTAENIDNLADAQNRVNAILAKKELETMSGRLTARHNCKLELYDLIGVESTR